ncbi:hypothetical protein [Geosporobacter ferrireducens]|uniref:hypothetical protein n=1 Tax=Geosporobacter ferrireducens TaxID=1424294 RepID=UPI00139EAC7C|nr:hypothetical protein [Geosporobacter ferrireducens]MTI57298.1 hypothetical protein [Geosporobacter ferrireducens]
MATSNAIEKETASLNIGKIIVIVLVVFTMIPATILGIMYFTNENFKYIANNYLSQSPGFIGTYFQSFPTREEKEARKKLVANYLLNTDVSRASDKLTIIKQEDEALYNDLIRIMGQINSKQTEKVLELLRDNSLKKDILTLTLEQIEADNKNTLVDKAKFYETLTLANLIKEIEQNLMNEFVSFREIGLIMEQMKDATTIKVLKHLDEDVTTRILSNFESKEKQGKIQQNLHQLKDKELSLMNAAQIYNGEKIEILAKELGDEKKYKLDELIVIFRNMDLLQTAKTFNRMEDAQFQSKLLSKMKEAEILEPDQGLKTDDVLLAMRLFRQHDERVNDLIKVYGKMTAQQIADLIENLYKGNGNIIKETFSNKESITITDKDLALGLLRSLKEKTQAEVIAALESKLGSEISKQLTMPD